MQPPNPLSWATALYDMAKSVQKLLPVEVINEEITLIDTPSA
jgi:hypothetical protein